MYAGVDIGGTKTLLAALSDDGKITEQVRFPTPENYDEFINDLAKSVATFTTKNFRAAGVGIPGLLEREAGIVLALGNLPWRDKPIRDDVSRIFRGMPIVIENDARLAGLSEAQLVKDQYHNVLFITVSTGIGGALIRNGAIVAALQDTEMGKMPLCFEGRLQQWEEFAGGRGDVSRFHQRADDITDPAIWQQIGENIAYGLGAVCSVLQPEAIILGGPVGAHVDQYRAAITSFLDNHLQAVVRRPKAILAAQRPEEAVIYGCYDLAKATFPAESRA